MTGDIQATARQTESGRQRRPVGRWVVLSPLLFLAVIAGIYLFLPAAQVDILVNAVRAIIVAAASVLPAMIYGYFIQDRRQILENEYKQNLRRLGFPDTSLYEDKFNAIYYDLMPVRLRPVLRRVSRFDASETASGAPSLGAGRSGARTPDAGQALRSATQPFYSPILITTVLTFLGWLMVFFPLREDPGRLLPNPTPLAYGFLGAYIFGLGSLVRQYVTMASSIPPQ